MNLNLLSCALVGATLAGCGPTTSASDTSSSSSATTSTDAVDPTTSAPTTSSSATTTGATDPDTCSGACTDEARTSFIDKFDNGAGEAECDIFAPDCPDGSKCAAWAAGGSNIWNETRCVPVIGAKQPGEPCTAEPGKTGVDDCAKGSMCWDIDDDDQGFCMQLCIGNKDMPVCSDPQQGCAVINENVLEVCLDTCAPLAQDCPGDDLCLPVSGTYMCVLDASGDLGATFDVCESHDACDKGLLCLSPVAANECDQGEVGCCLPMCSIAEGGPACPGVGQQCFPVYQPQPVGFVDVGYCSIAP